MIASRAELLTALGLSSSPAPADLALAQLVHAAAERVVRSFVKFDVEQAAYSEFYPDRGLYTPIDQLIEGYEGQSGRAVPIERFRSDNRILQMRQLPVRVVSAVYESPGAWDTASLGQAAWQNGVLLAEGPDYQVDQFRFQFCTSGFLFRRTGVWYNVERAVRVDYLAGFTPAELSGYATADTLATVAVTAAGSGYTAPPAVTIGPPNVVGGQQAVGRAFVLQGAGQGQVIGVALANAGTGYTSPPAVTIAASPNGSVAAATAFLSTGVCNYPEFKEAVLDAAVQKFNERRFHSAGSIAGGSPGAVVMEGIDGWSQSLAQQSQAELYGMQADLPPSAKRKLKDWIRYSALI